jgi:ankyrin repeat protein
MVTVEQQRLFSAISDKDIDAARAAIAEGADVEAKHPDMGDTPLIEAVWKSDLDMCMLLLSRGASLTSRGNLARQPLHRAAEFGELAICQLFVARGANIHAVAAGRQTALHLATWTRRGAEVCEFLVANGANLEAKADTGYLPIHYAARYGSMESCRYLVSRGFGPSYMPPNVGKDYLTPFQLAVLSGNVRVAEYFIKECGEDPAQRTIAGRTMLQLAGAKNPEMKSFLRALRTQQNITVAMSEAGDLPATPVSRLSGMSPL